MLQIVTLVLEIYSTAVSC